MYNNISKIYDEFKWDSFSKDLLKEITPLVNEMKVKTHIDFACGTGDFVAGINELGIKSSGVDISKEMIEIAKNKYPGFNFFIASMLDFSLENKVDFITSNYDSVNHLENFSKWSSFFNNVYLNLNNDGIFLFDINTLENLNSTNFVSYSENNNISLIKKIYGEKEKLVFNIIWFEKTVNGFYKRYAEKIYEISFPYKKIKNELAKIGFSKIEILNENYNLPYSKERLYILAKK